MEKDSSSDISYFLAFWIDQLWVRRYYVLIRREQIDEMVNGTSDVLHELCVFDSASEHAECLSSLELEEVVTFDYGPDAGQPAHIKEANAIKRLGQQVAAKSAAALAAGFGSTKRTLFTGIAEMFPVKFSTDEIADFTFQLSFPDRVLRLRAETKSSFDNWRALFQNIIPPTVCEVSHSGWLWRKRFGGWEQRFAIIYEGVLYFFVNFEDYEKFKLVASRGNDAIFVAAPLAEGLFDLFRIAVFFSFYFRQISSLSIQIASALKWSRSPNTTCGRIVTLCFILLSKTRLCQSSCQLSTMLSQMHGPLLFATLAIGLRPFLMNTRLASCLVVSAVRKTVRCWHRIATHWLR